jgi:hypothetical protein
MSFGRDGVSVFEGWCISVIIQFQYQFAPFMIGVHWMAHETNLVVQTFLFYQWLIILKWSCNWLWKHFFNYPKRHLKLAKLREIMETKGLKILNNVKTC